MHGETLMLPTRVVGTAYAISCRHPLNVPLLTAFAGALSRKAGLACRELLQISCQHASPAILCGIL